MENALTNKALVSKSTTNFLKVFFEIIVLCHHLYLPSTAAGKELSTVMGICAVAGFLFLSGYGVGMQYQKKGDAYISHLIKKRVIFNYLLIVFVNMCYLTLFIMKGGEFKSFLGALCSLLYLPFSKDYVTLSSWVYFIGDLLLYYVLFCVFAKIFAKKKNPLKKSALAIIYLGVIAVVALSLINKSTGSLRFLRACFMFPIGLLCAHYNDRLYDFIEKNRKKCIINLSIAFVLVWFASLFGRSISEYFTADFIVLVFVCIFLGDNKERPFFDKASRLVLIVYLSHEFFFKMYMHYMSKVWPQNRIGIIVVFSTIGFAVLFRIVADGVAKKMKQLGVSGVPQKR
ncbi:MAG: acyltransferase [Clostridia bacterium]|nr:acyltransferase [Clostridia bacterium]